MHEYEYVRHALEQISHELTALRLSNADLHSVAGRLEERLMLVHDQIEKRLDDHSERLDGACLQVAAAQKELAYVKAWSAGAGVACTVALSAIAWVISSVPSAAWAAILGAK